VQCAKGAAADIISQLDDEKTRLCFETEREVLRLLGANCTTPAGAYAQITNGKISLEISADGIEFQSDTADVAERFALAERLVSRL
jgi:porphobilinogen deaminase